MALVLMESNKNESEVGDDELYLISNNQYAN
jgi:hypothetical protein